MFGYRAASALNPSMADLALFQRIRAASEKSFVYLRDRKVVMFHPNLQPQFPLFNHSVCGVIVNKTFP